MFEIIAEKIVIIILCLIAPLGVIGIGEYIAHCEKGKPKRYK